MSVHSRRFRSLILSRRGSGVEESSFERCCRTSAVTVRTMQIGVGVEPSSRLRSPGQRPELWRRDIWFIAAASLICVAVVMAEPAWQLFSVAALFFAVVIAITRNDSRLWLFLTGVLSAFNFAKLVG